MKKINLLISLISVFIPLTVHASTTNYIETQSGIVLTQEKYNLFKQIGLSDEQINEMDQATYDAYIDMDKYEIDKKVEKYFRETTIMGYRVQNTVTEEISEYEYENEVEKKDLITPLATSSSHETTYKKLVINSAEISTVYPTRRAVTGILTWKKIPSVKSYDIFAVRTSGGLIASDSYSGSFTSTERTFTDVNCIYYTDKNYTTSYGSSNKSWNISSTGLGLDGAGFTAKLNSPSAVCINDLGTFPNIIQKYSATIGFRSLQGTTVYMSYQHATSNVNFNDVYKAYSFKSSGLGGVIYFNNSSLKNSYDGMAGVSLTL